MNPYATVSALNPEERERLILEHLPQVRLIARRIDRFDPGQKVKLRTYAEYKIRGAILDSLRGLDWAPRQQRRRSKLIELAVANLEQHLHRAPTEDEIAGELGLSLDEYHEWLVEIRGLNVGSLEHAPGEEDGRDLLKFISDKQEDWPSHLLERAELKRVLAQAISRMPYIERTVLGLYYQQELTLREISRVVKLHESRVSQLKTQAIVRLRAFVRQKWPSGRGI